MLRAMGACDPGAGSNDGYISQWFIQNGVDIIDYDLSMEILKSHATTGQRWIEENATDTVHNDFQNWVTWYEKLPQKLEAITYFGDHIIENTFMTTVDNLLHESIEEARSHIERTMNEIRDDYMSKAVLNGVLLDNEGNETWIRLNNPYKEDLSSYQAFVWHDMATGINNKTSSRTAAVAYYDVIIDKVNTMLTDYRNGIKIQQLYYDEARKYQVWVTVE